MTARPYPRIADLPRGIDEQISRAFAKGGLTGDGLLAMSRNPEAVAAVVAIADRLLGELDAWGPAYSVSLYWDTTPTMIAPGVYAELNGKVSPWCWVKQLVKPESGEWCWTDPSRYSFLASWQEVAPGVQVRWPSESPVNIVQVRTRVKPVVETGETADDETGWRPAIRFNLTHGEGLTITSEVYVARALGGNSWLVRINDKPQVIVDGSTEWRKVTPWVQVRWPNGPSDGLIEVRTWRTLQ